MPGRYIHQSSKKGPSCSGQRSILIHFQQQTYSIISLSKKPIPATLINTGTLIILDTLYPLAANPTLNLPAFLSSLITPTTSLLAIYHTDIPLPTPPSPYAPTPLTQLKYLATTILTTHSFPQVLARKRASEKSLAEPVFGLAEEKDGVIVGLGANDPRGLVLEMNHRRKSGRGIEEWFFLPPVASKEKVMLLSDHPLYRQAENGGGERRSVADEVATEMSTFNLGITEKQRRDREGVVLPYFDAQSGGGEGGRILYDMGVEDDFDEEEDEI
ncbi:hypothetical protein ACLMJK_001641 [Lecanora helva]